MTCYECSCVPPRESNGNTKKAVDAKGPVLVRQVETSHVGKGKVVASFTFAEEADDFRNGCLDLFGRHQMLISVQMVNLSGHRLLEPSGQIPEPCFRLNT